MTQSKQRVGDWEAMLLTGLRNENTRRNYRAALSSLKKFFPRFTGKENARSLLEYVRWLEKCGMSPQSLRQRMAIVRQIMERHKQAGVRKDNPVNMEWCPRIKISTAPRCPDKHELDRLDKILSEVPGFVGARDRAIVAMLRLEGLRINEVCLIDHEDIEYQANRWILKVKGKGGFVTTHEVWDQTITVLKSYVEWIPRPQRHGSLFFPEFVPGKRLDVRSIRKRCEIYFVQAKWRRGLCVHSLRHSLAVSLLENGVPLTEVQRRLRHRHLATTFHYFSNVPSFRNAQPIKEAQKLIRLRY